MKSNLSHILPVWRACEILGEPIVQRIVVSILNLRQNASSGKKKEADELKEEAGTLVEALFYKDVAAVNGPGDSALTPAAAPVPLLVTQAWKRLSSARGLALDKQALIQFLVPGNVQPHSGPSGHMGLFDCLIYAMQGHAPSSTATYYGGAANLLVWIPDVLIFLAVCKYYRDFQKTKTTIATGSFEEKSSKIENDDDDTTGEEQLNCMPQQREKVLHPMCLMAYRIYDSYQKKGTVARDTIHRFMTDVHGEHSYKEPKAAALLDVIFDDPDHDSGWLQVSVSELQFCKRVMDTFSPMERTHLLLDWIVLLGSAMIPLDEIPASVSAYLDTMDHRPSPICEMYAIAENRLFEIKRRFHSLVQSSSPVIQGDPMGYSELPENQPKQAISQAAFCEALSNPSEDLGHGGYLPDRLAKLVFRTGSADANTQDPMKMYWGLHQVLQFGCSAVRSSRGSTEDPDLPLLRFLFRMFQLVSNTEDIDDKRKLTRKQIAVLLVSLIEYAEFRRIAEAPQLTGKTPERAFSIEESTVITEEMLVPMPAAAILDILPPKLNRSSMHETENGSRTPHIALKLLVDYMMKDAESQTEMTFDEFCNWNREQKKTGPSARLKPIMVELRLIAAVLFGIPPSHASTEISLIAEIERRHKFRYPQTDVSRRGPRGTVWYIIDAEWYKNWASLVKKASGTSDDGRDGRADPRSDKGRELGRISNTFLLAENGSLALRSDIRWKHDYEILPPLSWSGLQAWYDGGPPIHRTVVPYMASLAASPHSSKPRIPTENEIELYPFFVTVYLCDVVSRGEARPFQQNFQLSRVCPVRMMLVQLCKELEVDPDTARLWVMGGIKPDGTPDTSGEEDWILELDANIVEQRKRRLSSDPGRGISLLLELKDTDTGNWPRGADGKDWSFREKLVANKSQTDVGDGIVGLYNMGNTCYLNASVQCLSHTPIFREYFTSKAYMKDINTTNPLGYEGRLAQVSAILINSLWKRFNQSSPHQPKRVTAPGSYALVNAPSLTPKTFKESLGKFNDIFSGNEQHDAQELLAFLLGGLSEDLNRIMEKPYIEAPDSDGRPDSELADIWWSNHLKREMSIIVALFTGQYKSLLTCRTCQYESARFEPWSFLQLPLPEDDHFSVILILYPFKEGNNAMRYCVRVRSDGKLRDVLLALAKVLEADEKGDVLTDTSPAESVDDDAVRQRANDLAVVDMRDGFIAKIAPTSWSLHDLQNKETGELPLLHVYELDPDALENTKKPSPDDEKGNGDSESAGEDEDRKLRPSFLAVSQRRCEVVSRELLHPLSHKVFGTPLLLRIKDLQNTTGRQLYDIVARRLRNVAHKSALRFLSSPTDSDGASGAHVVLTSDGGVLKTATDMESVAAGALPRYGFRLRMTSRDGRRCLSCPWYECCIGCLVPDDDEATVVMDGDSIAVDWHFAVDVATSGFGQRGTSQDSLATKPPAIRVRNPGITIKNHSSCGAGAKQRGQAGAITLEECLDAFAEEEQIPEAYCSKCKDFRVQTKRMSLWRLPPIVIIQLKRFQFTQHMRRKLRDLVVFPVEGLDLSRIMAKEVNDKSRGEETDKDSSDSIKDDGRSVMLYDLYGVVHHQGALSGGHYVASLKSELDGQWRLFNDAQIYEIHARDVVDSSAYILFYIRRDVSKAKLSDYWDVREGNGLSEQEVDDLLKGRSDRCVIS